MKLTKANTRLLETVLPRLNLNVAEPDRTEIEDRLRADIYEARGNNDHLRRYTVYPSKRDLIR
ncbi:hypothetical protein OVA29_11040 [Exiguobacterium sp. SL14]|nr:hypothetical protein [Exiguobacterium sp. SL14]MCY1691148.1 hypothetical protein [Exiguobacterium sp. SL14]